MEDSIEKRLFTAFCLAWNEVAPGLLGRASALSLLALREVNGEGVEAALAVAATWSSGFVADCAGALPGVLICLLKGEDGAKLERLLKQPVDGSPKPGGRALLKSTLANVSTHFAVEGHAPLTFDEVKHLELSGQEARLATIVGDQAWVGTFSLTLSDDSDTQALVLYAPHGLQGRATAAQRRTARREEPPVRNLERLLGIELEIVVRFGTTQMPLREVVRLGAGMMIELNRAVDEPVELLVNDKPLARGEVVVIDGYYGVRITEIGSVSERPLTLISAGGQA